MLPRGAASVQAAGRNLPCCACGPQSMPSRQRWFALPSWSQPTRARLRCSHPARRDGPDHALLRHPGSVPARRVVPQVGAQRAGLPPARRHLQHQPPQPPGPPVRARPTIELNMIHLWEAWGGCVHARMRSNSRARAQCCSLIHGHGWLPHDRINLSYFVQRHSQASAGSTF